MTTSSKSAATGEFALLAGLLQDLPLQAEGLLCGVGDDCAVLAAGGSRDWVISTDHFVEGVHFRRQWADWRMIGRRAALAAISDIAAMGGRPRFLVIGLSLPKSLPVAAIEQCFAGLRAVAQEQAMIVIGGDTTGSLQSVLIAVTAIGDVAHGRAIYRRGARVGDVVYVTGTLGGSGAGLYALVHGHQRPEATPLVERHLCPPSRVAVGQWLASTGCVSSMIDVSDGLVQDAGHIAAASRVKIQLEAVRIPLMTGVSQFAAYAGLDPLQVALGSGEEYELVFTVSGARVAAFRQLLAGAERSVGHPLTAIGTVVDGRGVEVLAPSGQLIAVDAPGFSHHFGSGAE